MEVRFCDETDFGFGWIATEPVSIQRTSHALAAAGGVWVIDPVDRPGIEDRIRTLGEPRGVLMLLDRHRRDSATLAERLSVPLHETPFGGVEGSPFRSIAVIRNRLWREVALWWPAERALVVPEAIGTTPLFTAGQGEAGVHILLRLFPPGALRGFAPEHLLVGHGTGVDAAAAAEALRHALDRSRRGLPRAVAKLPSVARR